MQVYCKIAVAWVWMKFGEAIPFDPPRERKRETERQREKVKEIDPYLEQGGDQT